MAQSALEWRTNILTNKSARQLLVKVLQPVVPDGAEPGGAEPGEDEVYLLKFVPYKLKMAPSDYPLKMEPHTVVEGFYKYGLFEMKDTDRFLAGRPAEEAK